MKTLQKTTKTAFLIHGSKGNPHNNWFPWLRVKLILKGYKVIVPRFPTPEGQLLDVWIKTFEKYIPRLNEETIIIGHSLGTPFTLNVLEKLEKPIKAAIFVGGFYGLLNNPKFDPIIHTFSDRKFNWEKIGNNCRKFIVINSDDDPYVPLTKGQELASALKTEVTLVPGGKHFNTEAGWFKFPQLVEIIKKF